MTVTTWTPRPGSELSTTASVAVSVLPSPVRISAMHPSCSTMPPISCTSKWRIPIVRLPASRTSAKHSYSRSSSGSGADSVGAAGARPQLVGGRPQLVVVEE